MLAGKNSFALFFGILLFSGCLPKSKYKEAQQINTVDLNKKDPTYSTTIEPKDEPKDNSSNDNTPTPSNATPAPINGAWVDNDIRAGTLFVAQKSCSNPAPANGGATCVTPTGWHSFTYNNILYARTCVNGGTNGRWLPYESIQAYWCDPPSGWAPQGHILPFSISKGEVGLMQRNSVTWNIDWNTVPGGHWWTNNTGRTLVVRNFNFGFDVRGSALRNADADVCMAVSTGPAWPIVEAICINQWLGPSGGQWMISNKNIPFPGRGIVILPGGAIHCDAQAVSREPLNVEMASVFACDFTLYDAQDPTIKDLPAYQTVRAPYFDEFTYTGYSQDTPHVNMTNNILHVNGVWTYASTRVRAVDVCLKHYKNGVGVDAQSCFTHYGYSDANHYSSSVDFANFYIGVGTGDGISAHCSPASGAPPLSSGESIDCAFYMMLSVHEDQNGLHPLRMSQTITPSWRENYCNSLINSGNYRNTDPSRGSIEACHSVLSN